MPNGSLPDLDKLVEIGKTKFTRREIQGFYDPAADDERMAQILQFGKDCADAHSSGAMRFIIPDSKIAELEITAILYFDCLPEDHPIKQLHPPEQVTGYLAAARLWRYGASGPDYIKN